jgi:glycosyltransferase involved in cell wall biosynthesis
MSDARRRGSGARSPCIILHVEAGPTFGGSTSALESYLTHGDTKRIVRDVLFHYDVAGAETIARRSRRFICLRRTPPRNWDVGGETERGGAPRADARRGGGPGPMRAWAAAIPGARAVASAARALGSLIAVELPIAVRVAREARRGGCNLIHSNNTPTIQRSTLIAGALAGKPVVAHVRTSVRLGALDKLLMNRCSLVIAQSASVMKELVAQGVSTRIVECFDGVTIPAEPHQVSDGVKGELLGTSSDTVLGAVGRLAERKGFRYLVDAMPALLETHEKLTLAIVGDGPLRRDLQRQAASLGLADRVRFLGFRRDLRYVLQATDIVVLPSLKEGLPIALLIAMAEGRPVVASDVDGIPAFVHDGETGLLVPPRDPGSLAEAVGRLLDDRALAARLGRAGRSLVAREASVKRTASRVDELLLSAV